MAMAVSPSIISLLFVLLMEFLCLAHAFEFHVGGDDGWTLKPTKYYNHWAERYRFQINDEIVFKYKKGHDSVLVVNENDYSKCNKENPIKILKDGDSKFKFEKSGPFFFISGHNQNCEKGEKLIVVVLSDRHRNTTHNAPSPPPHTPLKPPSSSPSPSPVAHHSPTPSHAPPTHSPSPSPAAHHSPTPSHAPHAHPPSHSPSPSPVAETPSHTARPHSNSPAPSPAAKPTAYTPPVESPSPITHHSPTPSHAPPHVQPPHSNSPAPSPATKSTTHAPRVEPPSRSPSPSTHEAESPKKHDGGAPQSDHYAPAPHAYSPAAFLPPHHAPAPAPSAASRFGGSLVVIVGFGIAATMISAGFV
ncbi:hypothetical protein ABFS82_13G029200 [Erythranthe guttata]